MGITGDVNAGKGKQHSVTSTRLPTETVVDLTDVDHPINDRAYSDKKLGSTVVGKTLFSGVVTGVTAEVEVLGVDFAALGFKEFDMVTRYNAAGVRQASLTLDQIESISGDGIVIKEDGSAAANGNFIIGDILEIIALDTYHASDILPASTWVSELDTITPA